MLEFQRAGAWNLNNVLAGRSVGGPALCGSESLIGCSQLSWRLGQHLSDEVPVASIADLISSSSFCFFVKTIQILRSTDRSKHLLPSLFALLATVDDYNFRFGVRRLIFATDFFPLGTAISHLRSGDAFQLGANLCGRLEFAATGRTLRFRRLLLVVVRHAVWRFLLDQIGTDRKPADRGITARSHRCCLICPPTGARVLAGRIKARRAETQALPAGS